jgi:large subunit ribosomal protein L32e
MGEDKPGNKALKMRRKVKAKKPQFVRYESWRYARLRRSSWRRQKGLDNKVRLKFKGWEVSPNVGYRGPRAGRDLHPSGYKEIIIHNLEELEGIDPKQYAVRIAHTVGTRKRMLILGKTEELGVKVLNPVSEITPTPTEVEVPSKEQMTKQEEAPPEKKAKKAEKKPKEEKKKSKEGEPKKEKKKKVSSKEKNRK